MSVVVPPPQDELELLIREARAHQRQRWLVGASVGAVLAAGVLAAWAAFPSPRQPVPTGRDRNRSGAASAQAGSCRTTRAQGLQPSAGKWHDRVLLQQPLALSSQAISGNCVYELISRTTGPVRGPYRLERIDLRSGRVQKGPLFSVGDLSIDAGKIWIFGVAGGPARAVPRLVEVDPRRLTVTRTISLPRVPAGFQSVVVTAGPGGSVWIGSERMLTRIDARSGKTFARLTLPRRYAIDDLATAPNSRYLYASLAHLVRGGAESADVREYDARSGRLLAIAAHRPPLTFSSFGANLTAVPGGVWASFRTGMQGVTIHLRQHDLALQPPPAAGVASTPANTVFHWVMSTSSAYGGGALWITTGSAIACLDPTTGRVRAREPLPWFEGPELLAVDSAHHRLFGLEKGLVQVNPPAACWR
jgi:hypothetical protein